MLRTLLKLAKVMAVETSLEVQELVDPVLLLVEPVVLLVVLGLVINLQVETSDKLQEVTNILLNAHAYSATSQD